MTPKFKPGDRVVNTSFASSYEGIGGTVVSIEWVPHRLALASTTGGTWRLTIILDTAERLITKQSHLWEHEQDYFDGSYIPF